jgi:hypothetical protein
MKTYRNITISSQNYDAANLAKYIELFCGCAGNWIYDAEKSLDYEKHCGETSLCIITNADNLETSAVFFTRITPNSLRTTNIVPRDINQLNIDQYNAIINKFASSLRKQAAIDKLKIRISLSKEVIKLKDVVTGKFPTKFFNLYLAGYPHSGHPYDTDRLDKFICSIFRFTRKPFNLHAFQYLLVEELGWSNMQAAECSARIEIGLKIIAAYKKF